MNAQNHEPLAAEPPLSESPVTVTELLARYARDGVELWAEGGQLRYRAPKGYFTERRREELRAHKDEVLAQLAGAAERHLLRHSEEARYEPFPLTDVQAAYLVGRGSAYDYGGTPCHAYVEWTFPDLDPTRLDTAWQALVDRHDMLRAVVYEDGYQQVLTDPPRNPIEGVDLRGAGHDAFQNAVAQTRARLREADTPPGAWPLVRPAITRGDGCAVLHLSVDLLVMDYSSVTALVQELFALYQDPDQPLPPLEISFRDYVLAHRQLRDADRYASDRSYWHDRIDAVPPAPELPLRDCHTDAPPSFSRHQCALTATQWAALRAEASARGLTPSGTLLAAYAEVIGAWSRQPRFTLNLPVPQRLPLHPQVGRLVGDFTAVCLLAVDTTSGKDFTTRAGVLVGQLMEDLGHSLYSGSEVLAELSRRRDQPGLLMPVVFTSMVGTGSTTPPQGWESYGATRTPQVWIDCQVREVDDTLAVTWDVRDGVFPDGLIEDAFAAFDSVLRRLADGQGWDAPSVVELPTETALRRREVNDTTAPIPDELLHEPALAQLMRDVDATAVLTPSRTLTAGELLGAAASVADRLRTLGHRPGQRVAIVMDKGWEQVVAAYGVLMAGGVYVPIDTNQPAARRRTILTDAAIGHVLTQSWLASCEDFTPAHAVVEIDNLEPAPVPTTLPSPQAKPNDVAYVIYTSGSTGVPKGVMVSHRAAGNTVRDINERFGIGPRDRALGLANLGFDLSVYDLFGPLAAGAALVLPDPVRRSDPSHWAELIARYGVTVWNSVPAQLQMLAHHQATAPDPLPDALRLALLSGDWIPVGLPDLIRAKAPGLSLVSLGGATEAAIWSIHYPIGDVDPAWSSIPYGRPLANQRFHVLDTSLRPRPDWVPGELYIGGAGLAEGYLGDEAKTRERFIEHPDTGERLYRTGDLGRYLPTGDIEFLGREDSQVKIRGYRIELAEVEAAVSAHPAVAAAAVLVDGDRSTGQRLAAFAELAHREPTEGDSRPLRRAEAALERTTADLDRDRLAEFLTALDQVALGAIARTLTAAGLFASAEDAHDVEEARTALRAGEGRRRLLRRWLDALVAEDLLTREGTRYRDLRAASLPSAEASWQRVAELEKTLDWSTDLLRYTRLCIQRLDELLRDELDIRSLLFPGAQLDTALAAYRDNLAIRHLNEALAAALGEIAGRHAGENPLRVLEIGGGVGGTTQALVPALAEYPVDYLFTDVSPFFLNAAAEQFADFPWIRYDTFDLNADPYQQGLQPNSFEVIVCANVLHNATDAAQALARLRELLVPEGWLVFIETTTERNYPLLVSMEFLEGLAAVHTDLRAENDQTFLTRPQWRQLLAETGATEPLMLPAEQDGLSATGQCAILTQMKTDRVPVAVGQLARHVANQLPDYMIPAQWRIVDRLPLTVNGKLDRAALRGWLSAEDVASRPAQASAAPADELEAHIAELWAELLDRPVIRRDDDFFALGGDSLLVARMVGQLRERVPGAADLEWEEVLRHLLRRPTIAGLAAYLRKEGDQETSAGPSGPYVLLNGGGGNPVTALVHAGTGTLVPYRALITEIRRQARGRASLVGLELPVVDEYLGADPAIIIQQWAADYAQALLYQGGSTFHVVGYCLGGLIATEVARVLTERGAHVASLTAISTHRPPFRLDDELISEYAFAVMMGIDPAAVGFPGDQLAVSAAADAVLLNTPGLLPDGAMAGLSGEHAPVAAAFAALARVPRAQRVARMCAMMPASAGSYVPDQLMNLFQIFRQSVFAISRYQPEPYAGDINFLRHSGTYPFPGNKESVTDYWERLAVGRLRIAEIRGDHFSCLSVPHVPTLVELLSEITGGDVLA
ncbi:amino acid adenylation domain-containing protein [Streptomyces sp. NPDC054933]